LSVKNIFSNKVERGSAWQRSQQSLDQMAAKAHAALQKDDKSVVARPRLSRHPRDAMWVSTRAWNRRGEGIALFANPSDMQWSMPRRGSVVKTTAGAVRNVWRNRYRKTYYDEGTVGITFQTGNIMPSMGYPDEMELSTPDRVSVAVANPRVPEGLMNFYKFIELLDQPMLLGPAENHHIIIHHSRVFPTLYMEGYFLEDSFNFSEVVQTGNMLQWNATFQFYRTYPSLAGNHSARKLAASYQQWIKESAQDEQIGWENLAGYLYAEGVSDLSGVGPVGDPKQGPTAAKQPTTIASMTGRKAQVLADQAAKKIQNDRSLAPLFTGL